MVSQASHCIWYHSHGHCTVWCCGCGGCHHASWDCGDWTTKEEISRKKRKEKKENAPEGKLAQVAQQCLPHVIAINTSLWSVVGPWCTLGVGSWAEEEVSKKKERGNLPAVYLQKGEPVHSADATGSRDAARLSKKKTEPRTNKAQLNLTQHS